MSSPAHPLNHSKKHKFVLWSLPRMGTRYVNAVLRQFGLETGYDDAGRPRAPTHCIGLPEGGKDYDVLCLARNPFTRALSGWKWRNLTHQQVYPDDFEQYIAHVGKGWMLPVSHVVARWLPLITHKIHLENHREEISAMPFAKGTNIEWPANSYRSHYDRPAMDYYTPELREKVFKLYEKDFEFGGYDPEADFGFWP